MRFSASRVGAALLLYGSLAVSTLSAQTITDFPITTADSEPGGITAGPDGNLWFTEFGVGKIGRITTGGTVTEFPAAAGGNPQFIVVGSDGNLWFTQTTVDRVGHMTTSGSFGDFPVLSSNASSLGSPPARTATSGSWKAVPARSAGSRRRER